MQAAGGQLDNMDYKDASENTRVAGVETKAINGNPHSTIRLDVDRSRSASVATENDEYDDVGSIGGLDGTSDYRGRGRGRGRRGRGGHRSPPYGRNYDQASPRGEKRYREDDDSARYHDRSQRFRSDRNDRWNYGGGYSGNRRNDNRRAGLDIINHRPTLSYDEDGDESNRRRRPRRSRSRSRSRSPFRQNRPARRDNPRDVSRSPYRQDRSRSPYRRNRSRSPYRRDRSISPRRRDKSRSPYRHDRPSRNYDSSGLNTENGQGGTQHGRRGGEGRRHDNSQLNRGRERGRNRADRRAHFEDADDGSLSNGVDPALDMNRIIDIDTESAPTKQDEDALIEARRRRRAEILAQFKSEVPNEANNATEPAVALLDVAGNQVTDGAIGMIHQANTHHPSEGVQPVVPENKTAILTDRIVSLAIKADLEEPAANNPAPDAFAAKSPAVLEAIDSPNVNMNSPFAVDDIAAPEDQEFSSLNELGNHRRSDVNAGETGAADYDEMMLQDDDRVKRLNLRTQAANKTEQVKNAVEEEDEDFDMFSDSPVPASLQNKGPKITEKRLDASMLVDDIDDDEGYLKFRLGEVLDNRFQVTEILGKGMFANVLRAKDLSFSGSVVAVKLLRNNTAMRKSGVIEIRLLQKLNDADPKDKMNIVRFTGQFEYKNHLCMVFENLNMNLRDVLKKFGRDVGLNIGALRRFAYQLFKGLHHLKTCQIIHADLKPDNILVTQDLKHIKICDLGTAADAREPLEITSYLASRFYRAPEVILGMKYDYGIDMWAIGCTLYELYTGKILYTGRSNNQMLKMMMESKGHFSMKFLKKGEYSGKHFNDNGSFVSIETDPKTHKEIVREITQIKMERGRDIPSRIRSAADPNNKDELREAELLGDLVDKCLMVIPDRRFTPDMALKHGFIHRPQKNVPQPKFTPTTLLAGGKQSHARPTRKRVIAADHLLDEAAQSPASATPADSRASTPQSGSMPPPVAPSPAPRKGFKKATTVVNP